MSAAVQIPEATVREFVAQAVRDVFATMVGQKPVPVPADADDASPPADGPMVVGTVGFAGECSGLVYLHLPLAFAQLCTGQLLGLSDADLAEVGDDAVNDAVGELTNMTGGAFKTGLCNAGHPCTLTIPSILRGSHFTVESFGSAVRHVYHFDCAGHRVTADIILQADE